MYTALLTERINKSKCLTADDKLNVVYSYNGILFNHKKE